MSFSTTISDVKSGARTIDRRVALALVYTAVILVLEEYFFIPGAVVRNGWFANEGQPTSSMLAGQVWVCSTVILFVCAPALFVRFVHRESLSSIGWNVSGLRRHLATYLGLYAVMVPFVFIASTRGDFTRIYPFVPEARTDIATFVLWECVYVTQFFALEAFFRGYLLFTCASGLGWNAIFVMVVPYAMIHFHKPWPEALGAIAAGVLLGALALSYRSFWGGVLLHALVAVTMDVLSVRKAGLF